MDATKFCQIDPKISSAEFLKFYAYLEKILKYLHEGLVSDLDGIGVIEISLLKKIIGMYINIYRVKYIEKETKQCCRD